MSTKRLIVVALIGILGLFALFFFHPPSFISKVDTEYTQGFSYAKLNVIKVGVTENRVLNLLGEPLYGYKEHDDCWYYSRAKSSWSDFIGWEAITVCFDNNHKVKDVGDNIFFN